MSDQGTGTDGEGKPSVDAVPEQREQEAPGRLPGPSVLAPVPTVTSSQQSRSSARVVAYIFIFACLVGLALWWKWGMTGGRSVTATPGAGTPGIHQPSNSGTARGAPSPIVDSEWVQKACTGELVLPKGDFRLVAAFQSTAGAAAVWEESLSQGSLNSPLRDVPPQTAVAICYIDGPWDPPPEVKDRYKQLGVVADRSIVLITQPGQVFAGPIGPHESLPIQRPAASPKP